MTAEEWAEREAAHPGGGPLWGLNQGHRDHAIAAVCLIDKSFGFTREDVDLLEELAEICQNEDVFGEVLKTMLEATRSLQVRIQALLPPEKT